MAPTRKPYVHVTLDGPDDRGDFGPHTPGTKTSGLQEALDYAHENCRDVYIWGGRGGIHDRTGVTPGNVYHLQETLRVPWSQDFRLDGGNYAISYNHPHGDAITIDSQMNCSYRFGLIVCASDGAAVRIKPETPGPDDFTITMVSAFEFAGVCSYPSGDEGVGILVDASQGPIVKNRLYSHETQTRAKGLHIVDDGTGEGSTVGNVIEILSSDQCTATGAAVACRIGDPGCNKTLHNSLTTSCNAPLGVHLNEEGRYVSQDAFTPAVGSIGVQMYARQNVLDCDFTGRRLPGMDLVFEEDSRENTVYVYDLPSGMTNRSRHNTDRLVMRGVTGFGVATPNIPDPGTSLINTTCQSVEVFITRPGSVSEWSLSDPEGDERIFEGGLHTGQSFQLDPGDRVTMAYETAPSWSWKALR